MSKIKDTSITSKEPPWTDVTTVMMRNLPNKYHQSKLLEELREAGFNFQNHFNFFYLPMDHSSAANLGYCFINFLDTEITNAFADTFAGRRMRRFNSSKTVVVMPASVQGYERNFAYYSSTKVVQAADPQYRPLFVQPSQCVRQPPPAGKLRLPAQSRLAGGGGANGAKRGGRSGPRSLGDASPAGSSSSACWSPTSRLFAAELSPQRPEHGARSRGAASPQNLGASSPAAYFRCEGADGWSSFECASPTHGFGQGCPPPR